MAQDSNTPAAAATTPVTEAPVATATDTAVPAAATIQTNAEGDLQVSIPSLAAPGAAEAPSVSAQTLIQQNEALALTKMGFSHLLQNSDIVGLVVLAIMSIMSVLTWYYIFYNAFKSFVVGRRTQTVMENFWGASTPQQAAQAMEAEPEYEPFSKIALAAASAAAHHADSQGGRMAEALSRQEFIDRAITQSAVRESAKFDSGLTLLATVGSTAPFVGLFGTVWGIYHALVGIGQQKRVSMDVVAGPVGEALIMTCIGLGVAIPSVLAYNYFVRTNNRLKNKIETFTKDLFDFFATGERVRVVKYGSSQSEPRVI
jgi:biopolymer transport protein ExbB